MTNMFYLYRNIYYSGGKLDVVYTYEKPFYNALVYEEICIYLPRGFYTTGLMFGFMYIFDENDTSVMLEKIDGCYVLSYCSPEKSSVPCGVQRRGLFLNKNDGYDERIDLFDLLKELFKEE